MAMTAGNLTSIAGIPGVTQTSTEVCAKHGGFAAESALWGRCPECQEELSREYVERERREREERELRNLLSRTNIPARFALKTFDKYRANSPAQQVALGAARAYADEFRDNLKEGRCLVFLGRPGTGKTHLGCALAFAVAQTGWTARYTTVADLIRAVRETWHKGSSRSERDVLCDYTEPKLLILDEVGVQFGTDTEVTQLTEVMDMRYRDLKPTVVISNCDKQGLIRYLGERAVDRLRENGGKMVAFDWESHRGR